MAFVSSSRVPAASKTLQGFDGIDTTGMASAKPGDFVPDHSVSVLLDDGRVFAKFWEAKNLNPGPLYPSSNAGRQLEWLRRNPNVEGEFTLIIGEKTELSDGMVQLIRDARVPDLDRGFSAVTVTVFQKKPPGSVPPFDEISVG